MRPKQHLPLDFAKVAAADGAYIGLERGSAAARGRFGPFAAGNIPYRALERGYLAATLAERRYKALAERMGGDGAVERSGRTEGRRRVAPEQKRRVEQAGLEPSRARMVFDDR